jgi:arsenate reductase
MRIYAAARRPSPSIHSMITLYGIPNCDTVKKARVWLADQQHDFTFHDFKKQGLSADTVNGWLASLDWEVLVNKKGTTWRGLPDERKAAIVDAASARALMLEFPSVIKRPVLQGAGAACHVGFSAAQYSQIFSE